MTFEEAIAQAVACLSGRLDDLSQTTQQTNIAQGVPSTNFDDLNLLQPGQVAYVPDLNGGSLVWATIHGFRTVADGGKAEKPGVDGTPNVPTPADNQALNLLVGGGGVALTAPQIVGPIAINNDIAVNAILLAAIADETGAPATIAVDVWHQQAPSGGAWAPSVIFSRTLTAGNFLLLKTAVLLSAGEIWGFNVNASPTPTAIQCLVCLFGTRSKSASAGTPPVITAISALPTGGPPSTGVTIGWSTDLESTSLIHYSYTESDLGTVGGDDNFDGGQWTAGDYNLVFTHSVDIAALTPGTLYYRVYSTDRDSDKANSDIQSAVLP